VKPALLRNLAIGLLGLGIGAGFLWLALRGLDKADIVRRARQLDAASLLIATAWYWLGLALRVVRWRALLRELRAVGLRAVGETLMVGYAVNNVLPARLGEVARAAYAKRRLGIGRARGLGSIVVERVLDLAAIMGCLGGGLILHGGGLRVVSFEMLALQAGIAIGVIALAIVTVRAVNFSRFHLPPVLKLLLADFARGLATLNRRSLATALVTSVLIWSCEVAALTNVFLALGIRLELGQALLIMGAASLSTLVPTAPGFLGTYQLVFVLAMRAFELPESAGIVVASALQVCLFGSVTLVGGLILMWRSLRHVRRWALG
jgi:uncharacterized protein (TIRG00374 family)